MQSNIKYSIFRYMPSLITTESIVVGVLIIIDDEFTFHPSTNLSRISNFDDELDISFMKKYLYPTSTSFQNGNLALVYKK